MSRSLLFAALAALALAVTLPLVLGMPRHPPAPPASPALQSLGAPHYDPHYGLRYWTRQLDAATAEWHQAVAFCSGASAERYPNCATVTLLDTASKIPGFLREEPSNDD